MSTVVQVPKRVTIKFSGKVMCSHSGTDSCVTNDSVHDISMKVPASGGSNGCYSKSTLDSQKLTRKKIGPGTDSFGSEDSEPDIKTRTTTSGGYNQRKSEAVLDAQRLTRRKTVRGRSPCFTDNSDLNMLKVVPVVAGIKKRKPEYTIDSQRPKRRKMDREVKLKCGHILRELLMHGYGWVFREPVDPVALNIPDYFDIISNPMDLGTIKSKLENSEYSYAEEFHSDVNLTFSNAMRYNPPNHDVNQMAKVLSNIFRSRWKQAVCKWNFESSGVEQEIRLNKSPNYCNHKKNVYGEKPSSNSTTDVRESITLEEKERLWKETMSMIDGNMTEKFRNTPKSSKLIRLMEGKIKFDTNDMDESTWLELRRFLKLIKAAKVVPQKTGNTGRCFLPAEVAHKGASGSVDVKPLMSSCSSKCGSYGGMRCHCGGNQHKSTLFSPNDKSFKSQRCAPQVDAEASNRGVVKKDLPKRAASSDSVVVKKDLSIHATSLDSSVARKDLRRNSLPRTHEASSKSYAVKSDITPCATTSGQDFHGFGSVKDEEKTSTNTEISLPLSTTTTPGDGYSWLDDQSCLEKAQRAAMLKSRFAETILRANGNSDPKILQAEREKLERIQREEEAKIKAIIEEQQLQLEKQIEKARQDALSAIEMIDRAAVTDDNLKSLKELESLCGCPPSQTLYGGCFRRRMQLIGLFLKEDDAILWEDIWEDKEDKEEGEI